MVSAVQCSLIFWPKQDVREHIYANIPDFFRNFSKIYDLSARADVFLMCMHCCIAAHFGNTCAQCTENHILAHWWWRSCKIKWRTRYNRVYETKTVIWEFLNLDLGLRDQRFNFVSNNVLNDCRTTPLFLTILQLRWEPRCELRCYWWKCWSRDVIDSLPLEECPRIGHVLQVHFYKQLL